MRIPLFPLPRSPTLVQILSDVVHRQNRNEDNETIGENKEIAAQIPFALVGSDREVHTRGGRSVRGRVP